MTCCSVAGRLGAVLGLSDGRLSPLLIYLLVHFDYKPPARGPMTRGVWVSAPPACGNYLILRDKVRAFPRLPLREGALAASNVRTLPSPTLVCGETCRDCGACNPRQSPHSAPPRPCCKNEHLDQLALEHLYGVRSPASAGVAPAGAAPRGRLRQDRSNGPSLPASRSRMWVICRRCR